ncbi:hypothetical protein RB195_000811 [Necator americanus]|uniref:RNA helicase n=1 Tax=Necator americanus TaxID=51031 RepID=A0ABR1DCT1_NECAM
MEFQEVIEVDEKPRTSDVKTDGSFESLMISPSTVANLRNHGYRIPSPVQLKAIPTGLTGLDMLVQAKSGTGKTLVFSILAVEGLNLQSNTVQKMIVAPTREIATQISETVKKIAHFKTRVVVLVGGNPVHLDVQALKRGAHIVIGTTGRICQMVQNGNLNMDSIDLFILDEADKLMEECFQKDINYLFSALPPSRQVAVFSATYPRNLDQLLSRFMRDASLVRLNSDDVQLIGIKQYVVKCSGNVVECLIRLLNSVQFNQALVFCNLHQQCEPTCSQLENAGFLAASISAQISQPERDAVIEKLKQNKLKVLISTDLTARGIDASNVNLVVNLETAINVETYFHRIGRAARYGGYGAAITILADSREISRFKAMVIKGRINVHVMNIDDLPPDLTTNVSFFQSCPLFQSTCSDLQSRKCNGLENRKAAIPDVLCDFSPTATTTSTNGSTYDRQTFVDISSSAPALSKQMLARINRLGIRRVLKSNNAPLTFSEEVAGVNEQILRLKTLNIASNMKPPLLQSQTQPSKYKFVPSREKAKKKFYMRGELLSIRDAVSIEAWRKLASLKFDMSAEPFVTSSIEAASVHEQSQDFKCTSRRVTPKEQLEKEVKKEPNSPIKRYTRKDLIAIQNSVPRKAWLPYVKTRWDTTQEPFQLDQRLRCSFEEQLRRKREIEKKKRVEVIKDRQKKQLEKPKLLASSRTPLCSAVEETSFELFCTRVKEQYDQFNRLKDVERTNAGAVVPPRDPPEVWNGKVNYYTRWLRNFDATFKYDVYKEAGWRRETSTETDVLETPVSLTPSLGKAEIQENICDSALNGSGRVTRQHIEQSHSNCDSMSTDEQYKLVSENVNTNAGVPSASQSCINVMNYYVHRSVEVDSAVDESLHSVCYESASLDGSDSEEDSDVDEECCILILPLDAQQAVQLSASHLT